MTLLTKDHDMTKTQSALVHHRNGDGRHRDTSAGTGDPEAAGLAVSATLHCLTGCAIGEIAGLVIATAAGLTSLATVAVSVALAFLFGYLLSTLPLVKAGMGLAAAGSVVLAADTLSIVTMEVMDNLVMLLSPGAMDAGLVNVAFWLSMALAFLTAFAAAVPVNRHLLARGKGHALTHQLHHGAAMAEGWRSHIPVPATSALAASLAAFMLGGLLVSTAADVGPDSATNTSPVRNSQH
jgi:hypothetical protein